MSSASRSSESSAAYSRRLVNTASVFIILTVIVLLFKHLASIIRPLFIAVFLYYVSAPVSRKLVRRGVPQWIADAAVVLVLAGLVVLFGWIIMVNLSEINQDLPAYRQKFREAFQGGLIWIRDNVPYFGERFRRLMSSHAALRANATEQVSGLFDWLISFVSAVTLVIFYLIFVFHEAKNLPRRIVGAFGEDKAEDILHVGRRINEGIINYIYVKATVSLVSAVLSTIILLLFGVKLAFLWGVLLFFGNFIPFVGSILTNILPLTFAIVEMDSLGRVAALTACLLAVQTLSEEILQPLMAEDKLSLSPLVVIASVAFWGWLWGVVGTLLSIPIMVSLKYILENIPSARRAALLMGETRKAHRSSRALRT